MNRYIVAGTSATSPLEQKTRKQVEIQREEPVNLDSVQPIRAFYIGGAGDKRGYPFEVPHGYLGPHGNALDVRRHVDNLVAKRSLSPFYVPYYLGYYEVYGDDKIKEN